MAGCELLLGISPASSTLRVFAEGMTPQFNGAHLGKQPLAGHKNTPRTRPRENQGHGWADGAGKGGCWLNSPPLAVTRPGREPNPTTAMAGLLD